MLPSESEYLLIPIWSGVIIFSVWLMIIWPIYLWVPTSSVLWTKKIAIPLGVGTGLLLMMLFGLSALFSNLHIVIDIITMSSLIPFLSIYLFKAKIQADQVR